MTVEVEPPKQNKLLVVLRWIVFFPASIVAALGIGLVVSFFISIWHEEGFWGKFVSITIGNALTGYFIIWIGTRIVPSSKKAVAFILGVFAIAWTAMALYGNMMLQNYWGVWQMLVVIVTVGYVLYDISKEYTDFFD